MTSQKSWPEFTDVKLCSNTLDPLLKKLSFEFIDEDDLSLRLAELFKAFLQQKYIHEKLSYRHFRVCFQFWCWDYNVQNAYIYIYLICAECLSLDDVDILKNGLNRSFISLSKLFRPLIHFWCKSPVCKLLTNCCCTRAGAWLRRHWNGVHHLCGHLQRIQEDG